MVLNREQKNFARFIENNDGRQQLTATIKAMPWPLNDREFVTRMFWWRGPGGAYYFAVVSVNDIIDYGVSTKTVRAVTQQFILLEPTERNQCRMTLTQVVDGGGYIPSFVVNSKIALVQGLVDEVRVFFSEDEHIDREDHEALIRIMEDPNDEGCSVSELASIAAIRKLAEDTGKELKIIESPSHYVTMKSAVIEGNPHNVGYAELILDGSLELCAANTFLTGRRKNCNTFYEQGGVSQNIHHCGNHSFIVRKVYNLKIPGFGHREFVWTRVWYRLNDGTILVVYEPIPEMDENEELDAFKEWGFPASSKDVVRASSWVLVTLEKLDSIDGVPQTKMS